MEGLFYDFRDFLDYPKNISLKKPTMIDIIQTNGRELQEPPRLKYFKAPMTSCYPLDLNEGFENYKFPHRKNNSSLIEEFLMQHDDKAKNCYEKIRVYSQRCVLLKIMLIPYISKYLKIRVTKFMGALYISENTPPFPQGLTTTHHHKLRQMCFSDSPNTMPDTAKPIDENIQIIGIYRNEFGCESQPDLGKFEIFYSAETSGIISENEVKPNDLKELNNCRFVHTKLLSGKIQGSTGRKKHQNMLVWYTQAQFCNVNDIYFGIKDKCGKVNSPIQHVSVNELPKGQNWKPEVCFGALYKFLTLLADKMADVDCPYTVCEIKSSKKRFDYKIYKGKSKHSFLSEEHIQRLRKGD